MYITFGTKAKGKSVELAVLRQPDYIAWMLDQPSPSGRMQAVVAEVNRLIPLFDAKPIVERCRGNCSNRATRFSVYQGGFDAWPWCDSCDPHSQGASTGRLSILRTYREALRQVAFFNAGRREDYRDLLKSMAEAKGLPARVGEKQAAAFF
jgi:hypothetical protein